MSKSRSQEPPPPRSPKRSRSRSSSQDPGLKRIWVGGLSDRTVEDDLKDVFSSYGKITDVRIRTTSRDTFAFVEFSSSVDAKAAIEKMDQTFIRQKRVKVAWADFPKGGTRGSNTNKRKSRSRGRRFSKSRSRSPRRRSRSFSRGRGDYGRRVPKKGDYKIVLENLPPEMSWMDLKMLGRKYGGSVTFARTWREGKKNLGLIEFERRRDMNEALDKLDQHRINGYKVLVYEKDRR